MGHRAHEAPASRHKCLIYEGHPSEQLPVIVPLLMDALRDNWRCLYLGDPSSVRMVVSALGRKGVDTIREVERGALIFSSERSYLDGGEFEPQSLVDDLCEMIDQAVRDGYQGLCATGDMMWELGNEKNFERLLEYEALLEQVFREKPLQGICQYRRDVVPARAIADALRTHRSTYVGHTLNRENLYFMPPELILANSSPALRDAQGQWMCEQILRVLKAEQKRDQAIASLMESEAHQRRLAEELAKTNQELELRVQERTAALEASNRDLEAFSYTVSHDLRAPLRAIDGLSNLMVEDLGERLGEDGLSYVKRVREKVRLMTDQIEGMLALARLNQTKLRYENVDLSAMARVIGEELQRSDSSHRVEVVVQAGLAAYGDHSLLYVVLQNLLGNAWKFTSKRDSARIEVAAGEPEGNMSVFLVRDNGAGFDMRHTHQLFGVLQRLHSSREFPGHGIGLATVQRIVQRHGGTVWAEGRVNEGATFYVALPSRPNA